MKLYKNEEIANIKPLYNVFYDLFNSMLLLEKDEFTTFFINFNKSNFLKEILVSTDDIFKELQLVTDNKISVYEFREIMLYWGTQSSYEKLIKLIIPNINDIIFTIDNNNIFNGNIDINFLINTNIYLSNKYNKLLTDNNNKYLVFKGLTSVDIVKFKQFLIKYTLNPYKINFNFNIIT